MKPVVFFDIDNTLVKGNTQRIMIFNLFKRKKVSFYFLFSNALWLIGYKLGFNNKIEDVAKQTRKAYQIIKGWKVNDFANILDEIFQSDIKPRIFKEALQTIEKHKQEGYEIVLVSGTIDPLAESIGKGIGIKTCLANRLYEENGIYTGEVENRFVYGQGKADLITKITREYDWDLNNSYAYTDHYTDSPLLSLVSNPRAVNPDKKLIAEAKLRHWPILIWKTTK